VRGSKLELYFYVSKQVTLKFLIVITLAMSRRQMVLIGCCILSRSHWFNSFISTVFLTILSVDHDPDPSNNLRNFRVITILMPELPPVACHYSHSFYLQFPEGLSVQFLQLELPLQGFSLLH
jgi:hypothetical protein